MVDIKGITLNVENVYKDMEPFLNEKVKKAFKNKVTQTIALKDNEDGTREVVYKVRFFGVQVNIKEIGIRKLAKILNDLSDKYDFYGTLTPGVCIPFANGRLAILSYIAFKPHDALQIEEKDREFQCSEGGEPPVYLETLEDLEDLQ